MAVSAVNAFPNLATDVDNNKNVAKARSDVVDIPIVVGDELVTDGL